MQLSFLYYRIPTVTYTEAIEMGLRDRVPSDPRQAARRVDVFQNPSPDLRSRAIRVDGSVWVVDVERKPWGILNEMTKAGVTWGLFDFTEQSTQAILEAAALVMREEIDANAEREAQALKRSDEALAKAEEEAGKVMTRELIAARKKHATDRKTILKRSEKLVADLEKAAKHFGLPGKFGFAETRQRVKGIRALNGLRAELYTQAASSREVAEAGLTESAGEGAVDALVMADAIDERSFGGGQSLREAFRTPESNGTATTTVQSASSANQVANGARVTRGYTVRTRNGNRTRQSDMTDREAAEELYESDDTMAADLSSRVMRSLPLSPAQRNWLHVLAVESRERRRTQGVEAADVTTSNDWSYNEHRRRLRVEARAIDFRTLCRDGLPTRLNVRSHRTGDARLFSLTEANGSQVVYEAEDGTSLLVYNV
jgi:hypothetical protein